MVASSSDSSLVGAVLDGRYEMLEVIGDGGVGVVYRARRVKLERMVAVKVLKDALVEDAGFVRRFQHEAVAMSRLHHPHCVAVTDFGVHGSRPYLVLEYVPGQTVTKLLERGPLDPPRAVQIALQLLETLAYFHRHHVIHRDLKSENVMLVESQSGGSEDFIKVLDFGMAKILTGPGADSQLSKIGLVPGTPSAMAPEQIRQLPPDPRIDIYATGILLYEMIVGRRPFSGSDMAAVLKMQISTPPKPPREILGASALSAELEKVIIRALEKDRVDRYGTVEEMTAELRSTPEGRAIGSVPAGLPAAEASARSQRRSWLLPAGVSAAIAVAGVVIASLGLKQPLPLRAHVSAPPSAAAALPAPVAIPAPPPTPAPAIETWLSHRDLAVTYAARGQQEEAFREVSAAITDNPSAAGMDPVLIDTLADILTSERVALLLNAFHANPRLVATLAKATANGTTSELRHAAYESLRGLGQEASADVVAMQIKDLEQAPKCSTMRAVFKELRASKDPRVKAFTTDLRSRGRKDRHVKCLRRTLRR